jgi:hypothetical protein
VSGGDEEPIRVRAHGLVLADPEDHGLDAIGTAALAEELGRPVRLVELLAEAFIHLPEQHLVMSEPFERDGHG